MVTRCCAQIAPYKTDAEGYVMYKKIAGLLGAAAALTTLGTMQANATPPADQSTAASARSYAELLDTVPNAASQLKADDAAQARPRVTLAQYVYIYRHHHHHHHHHHHGAFIGIPGVAGVTVDGGDHEDHEH